MRCKQTLMAVTLAIAGLQAGAECLTDAQVDDMAGHIAAKTPAATPEGLSAAGRTSSAPRVTAATARRV